MTATVAARLDSAALLDAIEARGARQACLIQVNVAEEASKKGLPPAELPRRCWIGSRP